jgi:hypothetical protein
MKPIPIPPDPQPMADSAPLSGEVVLLEISPGLGMLEVGFYEPTAPDKMIWSAANDRRTLDGKPVDLADLLAAACKNRLAVAIQSRGDGAGKSDFTTISNTEPK